MTHTPLRIGIVVGEASGDILGAGLMQAIRHYRPDVIFEGIGGERMLAQGFTSFFPQDRLAVMGLIEPLKRLPELLRIRKFIVQHFSANPPDIFIGIDSPDFNLTIEERLHSLGIRTVHYVSPSVWAWRQKRVFKIARAVDLMLTLLPFEADFYRRHKVPVVFVGHPLANEIPLQSDKRQARLALGLAPDRPTITLMPGSRGGEVKLLGPVFWQAARLCSQQKPNLQFIVPAANPVRRAQIQAQLESVSDLPIHVVDGQSHQAMAAADAVLMTSGTTTLEAMLIKRPMVVAYKMAKLSYWLLSPLVKTPFFSLPNLLAGRELVPELLQDNATPEILVQHLMNYFDSPDIAKSQVDVFMELHQVLRCDANEKAAVAVLGLLGQPNA